MMSGHGANSIFFNKKDKDWTSRTLATPHPLQPITSYLCLYPPILPPKSGRHMCITPKENILKLFYLCVLNKTSVVILFLRGRLRSES